jgi:hypothetical protein
MSGPAFVSDASPKEGGSSYSTRLSSVYLCNHVLRKTKVYCSDPVGVETFKMLFDAETLHMNDIQKVYEKFGPHHSEDQN